jgi:single-stranded-DNA-specific exonuclease
MGRKELYERLGQFNERIESAVENEKSIAIVASVNPDGLCSGSIAAACISRLGGRCFIRTVMELTPEMIADLKASGYDLFIFIDLGATTVNKLRDSLDARWLLIDHQNITDEAQGRLTADTVINLKECGIDGGKEISSGGLAYLLALEASNKNKDLSKLAVVSALAEKQDVGEKRSLIGINSEFVNTAQSIGALSVKPGLLITGETMPIAEAIASNLSPCIDGLTWNYENSYLLTKNSGLRLKNKNGQWRILAELDQEERGVLTEAIIKFMATSAYTELPQPEDLTGSIYSLREDPETSIRDARQFVDLLKACGYANKGGIGIGICMGDRRDILDEGERLFLAYKETLKENISRIFSERWRFNDYGNCVYVFGEGAVHETMIDSVCSFLVGCLSLNNKILLVRTITKDNSHYKFCITRGFRSKVPLILEDLVKSSSEPIGGAAWGRLNSTICEIPLKKLDDFMISIRTKIRDAEFEDQC